MLFWILLIVFFAFCGYVQADYNEKHADKDELRRKKATKEMYKRIESEALSKYPGIGGQYLKRRDYIKRRLSGEKPD